MRLPARPAGGRRGMLFPFYFLLFPFYFFLPDSFVIGINFTSFETACGLPF